MDLVFPLIRTRLSNERLMTLLLPVLLLYNLPRLVADPGVLGEVMLLIVCGLALDTAANLIRYRRPLCAVSAAVTALVLFTLSPGVPFWGEVIGVAAALIAGKQVWGGTGKNPVNPAMVGLLLLALIFPSSLEGPAFPSSLLLLPALLFSLPFLLFRPFAGIGMMAGMSAALLIGQQFSPAALLTHGIFFWGCLVISDPVTTTAKPVYSALAGAAAGFAPLVFLGSAASSAALGVIAANLISLAADRLSPAAGAGIRLRLKFPRRLGFADGCRDLSRGLSGETGHPESSSNLSADEIIRQIGQSHVFGCGGAAFPAVQKIRAVCDAQVTSRHLIVNGVECDPGLVHDQWLLRNHAEQILAGIRLLAHCIPFTSVTVAVRDKTQLNYSDPVRLFRAAAYYPAGAEKLLIRDLFGLPLASDVIPASQGILVLNVQTVHAIYEAVACGQEANTRLITLADLDKKIGSVVRVKLGADVHAVADQFFPGAVRVFTGGGIMNARLAADDAIVDEKVNCIATGRYPRYRESPLCSGCGLCSAFCPAQLNVREIARLVDEGKLKQAKGLSPDKCLACGSCSYICLAGRDLAARVRAVKNIIEPIRLA